VQKAEELQPDLIVLDIGLPTLNGMEAARRIRKLAPESKIIFLSQESSADVVHEALSLGALGYVVKAHAGSELLAAVEMVRQGRQFVSSVIVVATKSHRNDLFQRLQAQGLNIDVAIEQGIYIPLDVADTLSTFMVNDLPDPVRFLKVAGDQVAAAAKAAKGEHPRVAACGECAPTLWAQGKADAAVQLEHLWDKIAKTCNKQLSARTGKTHLRENLCGTLSRLSSVNGHDSVVLPGRVWKCFPN